MIPERSSNDAVVVDGASLPGTIFWFARANGVTAFAYMSNVVLL